MERSVNKLTSKTVKPLKPKHVQILTGASWQREIPISELFRFLNHRLRENHWVIAFKALITVHILMREGATDRVIGFVASNAGLLNMSAFRDRTNTPLGHEQSKNLRAYALYLEEKVLGYRELKVDFVRSKPDLIARFRSLPIEEGLLKEVEVLQRQINALLGCTFYLEEIDNVVTLQAFRLLIGDMMALFHLLNEAVIRILGEYFEMSKADATRALQIYKNFAQQTTKTVEFFEIARRLKHALGLEVPVFKHAPVSLAGALEDYLKAPDFEAQRIAYKQKKANKNQAESQSDAAPSSTKTTAKPSAETRPQQEPVIDFFSSLDDELNALSAPSVQAQYDSSDPFGSYWTPDNNSNPFGAPAAQGTNPFAQKQQELQQQTQDINRQLAAIQAGLSTFNQPAAGPANQMVVANQGFPLLQQQQQPSQAQFAFPAFGTTQSPAHQTVDSAFTVENVFGAAPNPFVTAPMGQSSTAFGGGGFPSAMAASTQYTSAGHDPFAGLGILSAPSTNPTLDPFSMNRSSAVPLQQMAAAAAHNPFAPTPHHKPAPMTNQPSTNYIASPLSGGATSGASIQPTPQRPPFSAGLSTTAMGAGMMMMNPAPVAFNPFATTASPGAFGQGQAGGTPATAAFNPFATANTTPGANQNAFGPFQNAFGQQAVANGDTSLI